MKMKHTRKRLTALLLTAAMALSLAIPTYASEGNWWEKYVTSPMEDWSIDDVEDGHVTSHGRYVLVTSDTHRYTYLAKNLLEQANKVIAADGETGNVGLMSFGGDFANEKVLYDDNMSIVKAALQTSKGTVATYTKGNHEGNVSDEDFLKKTGMSRIGETAVNDEGYYHFFNFGALNGTQQFTDDDIAQLEEYLAKPEVSGDGKPIIIVSHYPLHYYNDRRTSAQAAQVLDVLNNYPQVIFLWGHNHTEADPNYGMIRVPGDVIQTTSSVDSTKEIKFTYACLGALRDGINEANGLLMKVNNDGTTTFRYIGLHANAADDAETWTDAQGNENPVRVTSNEKISSDNTYAVPTEESYKTISLANVQIARPLVDKTPAETASVFSPRFTSGSITWTANGENVTGSFDFDTTYTATFTLTAAKGYTFANEAKVSINKEYVGPAPGIANHEAEKVEVSADGSTATVTYTFDKTTAKSEKAAEVADLKEGSQYVMAAIDENMAASYLYNPADHGEESRPSYTAAPADVVVRNGELVSVTTPSMVFTAQKDAEGFLLWSDASLKADEGATTLNFLSMSTKGGDLGLEASESAGLSIYTNWNSEDGIPYLDIDGVKEYAAYQNGAFCYVTDPEDSNVRLFKVGINNEKTIYNVTATVETPAPGAKPSEAVTVNPGCTVENVKWNADAFTYDTPYTVTLTLKAAEGYTVSDALIARVNGDNATIEDGTLTVTYTFPATTSAPGLKIGLQGKAAEGLKNGKQYVITVNNQALTAAAAQGIYLAAASTEKGLTSDMVFTAAGNDTDGYTLKNGDQYLAGRPVDDSPDQWGFMLTNEASSGLLFTYEDGKLKVVSSGTYGAMGPPPGAKDSYLYLNGNHFNFGSLQSTELTIQELFLPFTDVEEGRWSYDKIYNAAATGIMVGEETTLFAPTHTMTRAMAITVLYRMAGAPEVTGNVGFTDIKQDYYTSALIWGAQNKIVVGDGNGKYRPNDSVSRQEFTVMLRAYLNYQKIELEGEETITFKDAGSIESWAKEAVESCVKGGIIHGYEDGTFRPYASITREEAATMLSLLLKQL
jgi:hypothetical protein